MGVHHRPYYKFAVGADCPDKIVVLDVDKRRWAAGLVGSEVEGDAIAVARLGGQGESPVGNVDHLVRNVIELCEGGSPASCRTPCCSTRSTRAACGPSRGLGRNVQAYKRHLAACDLPRRNDLDGRGSLSEEELASFTTFFLKTCIDQVDFMAGLVEPDQLRSRIRRWAAEETDGGRLPAKAIQRACSSGDQAC